MTCPGLDSDQGRRLARLAGLQTGAKLEPMPGYHTVVVIACRGYCGRIFCTGLKIVCSTLFFSLIILAVFCRPAYPIQEHACGMGPVIDIEYAASGKYAIWVGMHQSDTYAPGMLFITESTNNTP